VALALALTTGRSGVLRALREECAVTCADPVTVKLCVRKIKVKAKEGQAPPAGGSATDVTDDFLKKLKQDLDKIWCHCCIFFEIEKGESVELPANWFFDGKLPVASAGQKPYKFTGQAHHLWAQTKKDCLSLYYAADVRFSDTDGNLLGLAKIGGNGMVVDDGVSAETVAHEIGHNLNLGDLDPPSPGNLMNPDGESGTDAGTALTERQCDVARKQAKKYASQGYK
jgi:hypothetical protein